MKTVSVAEARRTFKALLDEVSSGHPVSVVRRGREVARRFLRSEEGAGCQPCCPTHSAERFELIVIERQTLEEKRAWH